MHKKTAAFHNLGCKVNSYETEAAARSLKEAGYEIVPFDECADVYVVNTCSVTNIADKKSRQMIRRAKKLNPEAIVVAMGCYVQADAAAASECADIVVGNKNKGSLARLIEDYENGKAENHVEEMGNGREYEELGCLRDAAKRRVFVKVQDGCDMFCSYCVIPYVRGRSRSRRIGEVLKEVRALSDFGCKEIVLSGIHLSSYGKDLKGADLTSLLAAIEDVGGIGRIRLGSLDPDVITEDFVEKLAACKKLCPHFHLSLQSGCDKILRAMNRKYTTDEYRKKCELLRKHFKNPSITTDIITGFPGESDEDFEETYRFVDSLSFFETHVFPFSARKGTRAAKMDGQLSERVRKERALRLIALSEERLKAHLLGMVGSEVEALIEERRDENGEAVWLGHTRKYEKVATKADKDLQNEMVRIRVTGLHRRDCAFGEPV